MRHFLARASERPSHSLLCTLKRGVPEARPAGAPPSPQRTAREDAYTSAEFQLLRVKSFVIILTSMGSVLLSV